ncbi:MAG: sterol desaturase family protein, partial [bacterium]
GLPVEVILIYEPLSLFFGMFAHGNMKLPRRMERIIRLLFVTPTMHCVHHSVDPREHNSNYGSIFSFWDRMFGSYTDKPHAGYEGLEFGIRSVSEASSLNLWGLLLQPFRPRGNW